MVKVYAPIFGKIKAAYLAKIERALDVAQFVAYASAKQTTLFRNRTGALRRSIRTSRSARSRFVSANTSYAAFIEYGTRFMAARPFMRQAHKAGFAALRKVLGG
jgi:HK97 gp10 family phage protein